MLSTLQLSHTNACLIGVAWGGDHSGVGISCTAAGLDLIGADYSKFPFGMWFTVLINWGSGNSDWLIEENPIDFYNDILISCISDSFGWLKYKICLN